MYYALVIFLPLVIVSIFIGYKVFRANKKLQGSTAKIIDDAENYIEDLKDETVETVQHFLEAQKDDLQKVENSLEHAKEILFNVFHFIADYVSYYSKKIFSFSLHIFVIILKFLRDYTDIIYAKSRDFFLYTATKEKETVNAFWHTLKEYKKESDSEKEDK